MKALDIRVGEVYRMTIADDGFDGAWEGPALVLEKSNASRYQLWKVVTIAPHLTRRIILVDEFEFESWIERKALDKGVTA